MLVDSFMLAAVVHELNSELKGSAVRSAKAIAPFAVALLLQQRGKGKYWLITSAHTRYAHIGWQKKPVEAQSEGHEETERFADVLRRHLEQARFVGAEQIDFDRLVALHFINITPLGERKRFALWCEIMGKHSNLVLVDEGSGLIVDALKRLPSSLNRYREVLPGKPYIRPPSGERRNPLSVSFEELSELTVQHSIAEPRDWAKIFFGMSEPLLALMEEKVGEPLTKPENFWRAIEWLRETIERGKFEPVSWTDAEGKIVWCYPLPVSHLPTLQTCTQVSSPVFGSLLTDWLSELAEREVAEQRRQSLLATLRRNLEGIEGQIAELQKRFQEAREAEKFRKWGELLLTFAHEIPNDAKEAIVTDYGSDPPQQLSIPLPEGKTATEAAQHYFALYRKLKNAAETLPSVLEKLQERASELRKLLERVELADESQLTELASQLPKALQRLSVSPQRTQPERDGDFLRFTVSGGYEVWVGRNAEANTKLLRVARPDDLWFHVKGAPGSHALLRVQKRGEEVPQRAIKEAAQLAAFYSSRKTSSWVEVDYTRARYVRPAKGQKGLAFYTNFKTIAVEPKLPTEGD
jgi:predicted ribosome quality control (RQC) complex YloA/Tae2 family protein